MIADQDSRQTRTASRSAPRARPRPGASCGLLILAALGAVACADRDAAPASSHPSPLELAVAPGLDPDGGATSCQTPAGHDDGWGPREGAPTTLQAPLAFEPRFGRGDAGGVGAGAGGARPPVDNIVLEAIAGLARAGVPLADAEDEAGRRLRFLQRRISAKPDHITIEQEPIDQSRDPGMTDAELREKILAQLRERGFEGDVTVEGDRVLVRAHRQRGEAE